MSQIINSQKPIDEILYDLINQEKFDIIEQIILCDDKFDVNILVNGERKIKNKLYYTELSYIKKVCEINFGKTEISKHSLLAEDITIIIKKST